MWLSSLWRGPGLEYSGHSPVGRGVDECSNGGWPFPGLQSVEDEGGRSWGVGGFGVTAGAGGGTSVDTGGPWPAGTPDPPSGLVGRTLSAMAFASMVLEAKPSLCVCKL